jgi:hypothetical protein
MTSIPALVYVNTDTYDYLREILGYLKVDFSTTAFPNDEIAPSQQYFVDIVSYSRSSGKATITTDTEHNLIPGQMVEIQNVPVSGFSGSKIKVLTTPSTTSFTYASLGINISTTAISGSPKSVTIKKVESQVVTLTTATAHGFDANDIVIVDNISSELNGTFAISAVPSTTTFQYYVDSTVDDISEIELQTKGTAVVGPILKYGTYGAYTGHSDIGINVQTEDYSGKNIKTDTLRGAQLTNIGDHLDSYSNTIDGFEYRIDCSYDKATNKFSKTFVVLPINPLANALPYDLYPTDPVPAVKGNIDLRNRPQYVNQDGSVSTILSISTNIGGYEILLPTIIWNNGVPAKITTQQAIAKYGEDGLHLGKFNLIARAEEYAIKLHDYQQRYYVDGDPAYETPEPGIAYPVEAFKAERLVFEHPGNILEASMEENASDSATRFWVQGDKGDMGEGASLPYSGVTATGMLADGWPLLDLVEQYQTDDEFILAQYAQRYLEESVPPVSNFTITVNGSVTPEVGMYYPGDWCSVIIDDVFVQLRMASGLEPREQVLVRKIDAFTVTVPNSPAFPESVSLELVRESQVDKIGY